MRRLFYILRSMLIKIGCIRCFYAKKLIRDGLNFDMWGGTQYKLELNTVLQNELPKLQLDSKSESKLVQDIVESYLLYGATPEEYFAFGFNTSNSKRRSSFLTNQYKDKVLIKEIGLEAYFRDLRDKYQFYKLVGKYFKRDVIKISSGNDLGAFDEFCRQHNSFIAKPLTGMCGSDVHIYNLDSTNNIKDLFKELISRDGFIIEELIRQSSSLAMWNESSVNTIRIPSFLINGKHTILRPFIRTGRKGMIVDNGAAGGIFAIIDENSGVVISDGYDEKGNKYICHPDSLITYKGFNVPNWDSLLNLAKKVHETLPQCHKYVAFDFALTDDGWVLIEGNWGQFLSEYALKEGIKEEFASLFLG